MKQVMVIFALVRSVIWEAQLVSCDNSTLRDRNGLVEFHDNWYDHIFIQEGEGTFLTGGTMVGAVDSGPGEKRAISITGGTSTPLRAGDYFLVPPHVPHQMLVAKGQRLRFVVFKISK